MPYPTFLSPPPGYQAQGQVAPNFPSGYPQELRGAYTDPSAYSFLNGPGGGGGSFLSPAMRAQYMAMASNPYGVSGQAQKAYPGFWGRMRNAALGGLTGGAKGLLYGGVGAGIGSGIGGIKGYFKKS